jgi:bifunctional enzyme CysN/CysC
MVVWMNDAALEPGKSYLLKTATTMVPVTVTDLRYRMDVETLRSEPTPKLALNEIGRIRLESARTFAVDAYAKNRQMGGFILIDRMTNATLAAGMILERQSAETALDQRRVSADAGQNLRTKRSTVDTATRHMRAGQKPFTLWISGLPRSGKSSIAFEVEKQLFQRGKHALVLDGEVNDQPRCAPQQQ